VTADPWIASASVAAIILVCIAAYTDIRSRRVPNALTVPAFVLGLALSALGGGWHGLASAGLAAAMGLGVWILGLACGGVLGGGDAKLLMALGALCGPHFLAASFVVGVMVGGVLAVILALRHGRLKQTLRNCFGWAILRAAGGGDAAELSPRTPLRLPYAVPIAIGVLVCLAWPDIGAWAGLP
jgi:prepilin peptidase CpaA